MVTVENVKPWLKVKTLFPLDCKLPKWPELSSMAGVDHKSSRTATGLPRTGRRNISSNPFHVCLRVNVVRPITLRTSPGVPTLKLKHKGRQSHIRRSNPKFSDSSGMRFSTRRITPHLTRFFFFFFGFLLL